MGQTGQTIVMVTMSAWNEVWAKMAIYIPQLVGAIILLIIGLLIAKAIEKVVVQILKLARFDVLSEKAGIASILAKGEIKQTLSELLGVVVYWLLVLVSVIIALNAVGLTAAGFLDQVAAYAAKVVLAIFVLVLGLFFAALIGSIVRTAASNAGVATAKNLGQITQIVIVVITVLTVMPMLGVRTTIIDLAISILLASAGLGLALAFGLGSKDVAGRIVSEFVDKWKKR